MIPASVSGETAGRYAGQASLGAAIYLQAGSAALPARYYLAQPSSAWADFREDSNGQENLPYPQLIFPSNFPAGAVEGRGKGLKAAAIATKFHVCLEWLD